MEPLAVIESEVPLQSLLELLHRLVILEVYILVLEATPEPLHEYVVERSIPPVHADPDTMRFKDTDERLRCKLTSLVRIKYRRHAPYRYRFFESRDAELGVHRVRYPPGQHLARIEVDNRREIHVAALEPDIGDIRSPDLVR